MSEGAVENHVYLYVHVSVTEEFENLWQTFGELNEMTCAINRQGNNHKWC